MAYKRRRKTDPKDSSANVGQLMNLSLFIMLLAFFIVLNSISSYEEAKQTSAVRSVDMAFSSDARNMDDSPSLRETLDKSVHHGHVFERLNALFESQISSYKMDENKNEGTMTVEVSVEEFSKALLAAGQSDLTKMPEKRLRKGKFLLPTLVSLLRTEKAGLPMRMEMIMHVEGNPANVQNQQPRALKYTARKLSEFSKRLEAMSFPQKLLNIAISKGDSDTMTLIFRRYNPLDLAKQKEEPQDDR